MSIVPDVAELMVVADTVLPNWDTPEMKLGEATYAIWLGYDASVINVLHFSRIVP
jgi:hypothetical protein